MEPSQTASSRRTFLSLILGGLGATLAAAAGFSIWRFLLPPSTVGKPQSVSLNREEIPYGEATFITYQGSPVAVLQLSPGKFVALSAVCTHLGCIVQWQPDKGEFLCPCHAGRFSAQGEVLGGPPPKPLESIPVVVLGDQIVVG